MKKILLAMGILATSSTIAFAETDWTGFYAGANLGYGWAKNDQTNNDGYHRIKPNGMIGGIQGGYNYQFENNFVLGAEAQLSLANIKKSVNDSTSGGSKYSPYRNSTKIKNAFGVNVKAGYAIDKFLPYVTAGLTYGKREFGMACDLKYSAAGATTNGCKDAPYSKSASKTSLAYNLGVGLQYKVSKELSVGAEYRYTRFNKKSVDIFDPQYPSATKRDFKTSMNTLNFSLNYHF